MAETCETMTVKRKGGKVLINVGDFNPETDEKCEADAPNTEATSTTGEATGSEATGESAENTAVNTGEVDEKIDAIVEAIKTLDRDNKDHFTKKGLPRDTAVEAILGFEVSKEERAEAWERVQASEEPPALPTE